MSSWTPCSEETSRTGKLRHSKIRAREGGFAGTKLERSGCSTFRVVVTGVPADDAVQADVARQAEGVGLPVEYEAAVRYPEVPSDVAPVAAR